MPPSAPSTSPSNETVRLKLPSGEMVNVVVPSGMPDEAIKSLLRTRHPEFFQGKPVAAPDKSVFSGTESFSAYHPKEGLAGVEEKFNDIRQRLSEHAARGVGQGTGDFMASLPLGVLKAAKSLPQLGQGKFWEALKSSVGGLSEAATIPAAFVAPEAGELGPSASLRRAGALLEDVEKSAGRVPVNLQKVGNAALRIQEMSESGSSMPQVVRKFLNRATSVAKGPPDYSEMRKFYENVTRLSVDEGNRLTPKMKYLVGQFKQALDEALYETASKVGKGGQYARGMHDYYGASRYRDVVSSLGENVKGNVLPWMVKGGAGAVGAGAGYRLFEMLFGGRKP